MGSYHMWRAAWGAAYSHRNSENFAEDIDQVHFKHAIPAGTLIELVAKVVYVGNTSLKIQVDIFLEEMYSDTREKAITGMFTFVAIDEERNPIRVVETFVKE